MDKYFTEWKAIDTERAARALDNGGTLFDLPHSFGNGAAVYRTGLQTKRGTCYLISDRVKHSLLDTSN